jgi:hypothetical protein
MELRGDMNLHVSDAAVARVKLTLEPMSGEFGADLQLKQHPHVEKFGASDERVVKLKDPSRSFPVGQSLAVLKWRYTGKDESLLPLSSTSHTCLRVAAADLAPSQLLADTFRRRNVRGQHRLRARQRGCYLARRCVLHPASVSMQYSHAAYC